MDDGLPRALAAGRGPRGSVLAVSSGLLSAASPAELEAVLAHELAHVRHRDVVVQTSVVVLAATLLELSRVGGWFQRVLLLVSGSLPLPSFTFSSRRSANSWRTEPRRQSATRHIRWPMHLSGSTRPQSSFRSAAVRRPSPSTRSIRFSRSASAALFVTHPPVGERVRRLRELDPDWREKLRAA